MMPDTSTTTLQSSFGSAAMKREETPCPIVYIDSSRIRPGRLADVARAATALSAFIEANNPHIVSYNFYLDEAAGRMTVVAVHPDSAALQLHMEVGDAEFRKFADLLELASIDVYGEVSESVRGALDRKAAMLGEGAVTLHLPHAGFGR